MAKETHLSSTIKNHHLPIFSLASFLLLLNSQSQQPPSEDTFDFIVVGGGTAGCAVASRLSENGRFTVLLLEAGGLPDPRLDIPAFSADTLNANPDRFMKAYKTVPQQNAKLKENGIVTYLHGQTLGGGSSVNLMYFNRGSPFDYDQWANITGDESWSYESMLRYFKKSEDYLGAFPSDQHGHNGPIAVQGEQYTPGLETWLSAGKELGYPIADQNGPQKISFIPSEFSKRQGRRVSSYTGYLKLIIDTRKNLKVITNAKAMNLVFDDNKKCIGVNYTLSSSSGPGRTFIIFVQSRKELY